MGCLRSANPSIVAESVDHQKIVTASDREGGALHSKNVGETVNMHHSEEHAERRTSNPGPSLDMSVLAKEYSDDSNASPGHCFKTAVPSLRLSRLELSLRLSGIDLAVPRQRDRVLYLRVPRPKSAMSRPAHFPSFAQSQGDPHVKWPGDDRAPFLSSRSNSHASSRGAAHSDEAPGSPDFLDIMDQTTPPNLSPTASARRRSSASSDSSEDAAKPLDKIKRAVARHHKVSKYLTGVVDDRGSPQSAPDDTSRASSPGAAHHGFPDSWEDANWEVLGPDLSPMACRRSSEDPFQPPDRMQDVLARHRKLSKYLKRRVDDQEVRPRSAFGSRAIVPPLDDTQRAAVERNKASQAQNGRLEVTGAGRGPLQRADTAGTELLDARAQDLHFVDARKPVFQSPLPTRHGAERCIKSIGRPSQAHPVLDAVASPRRSTHPSMSCRGLPPLRSPSHATVAPVPCSRALPAMASNRARVVSAGPKGKVSTSRPPSTSNPRTS